MAGLRKIDPREAALVGLFTPSPSSGPAVSDRWYELTTVLPGERVPVWLHAGRSYRGVVVEGGESVKLFAPDSELTTIVSASLVRLRIPPAR